MMDTSMAKRCARLTVDVTEDASKTFEQENIKVTLLHTLTGTKIIIILFFLMQLNGIDLVNVCLFVSTCVCMCVDLILSLSFSFPSFSVFVICYSLVYYHLFFLFFLSVCSKQKI